MRWKLLHPHGNEGRMVKVYFASDFPEYHKEATTGLIRMIERWIPVWVYDIHVSWSSDNGAWASMTADFNYRTLNLTVYKGLFDEEWDLQYKCILHEILHVYNVPVSDVATEILNRMFPEKSEAEDPTVRELYHFYQNRIVEVVERANVDLTEAVTKVENDLLERRDGRDG